jgi:hypothetical protein
LSASYANVVVSTVSPSVVLASTSVRTTLLPASQTSVVFWPLGRCVSTERFSASGQNELRPLFIFRRAA